MKRHHFINWVGLILLYSCSKPTETRIDVGRFDPGIGAIIHPYISSMTVSTLGGEQPEIEAERIGDNVIRLTFKFNLADSVRQDDWKVSIRPAFDATFHWSPHLTPTDRNIIAQHVFRSPALIVGDSLHQLTIIPDLDLIGSGNAVRWYLDLDAPNDVLVAGVSNSKVTEHVLFERTPGMVVPPDFEFGFYILVDDDKNRMLDPWRTPLSFMWEKWGRELYETGQPINRSLAPYVDHTYRWAFESWRKNVWQEFSLNGKKVGAPVFIVNVTQSPNYPGEVNEREFRSIWNQAWFSSLRSAQGLYRNGRRNHDKDQIAKANMTKELALLFPQKDGLFPSVIGTQMEEVGINGQKVKRSKGWDNRFFGNSNRNPVKTWGSAENAPYHILDMSWTAYLMLTWNEDLQHDDRLVAYAKKYADRLVTLQDSSGFFPGWLDVETEKPLEVLNHSPETSMSVSFLLKIYKATGDQKYFKAAEKAMDAVIRDVVPRGQWEDFETYWSCSRVLDSLVGKKIVRNNSFKQNTLSMFWTAEALFNFYKVVQNPVYIANGRRVLDELLMYQASWQPPFIPIHALGGFGVMNGDGEWNDSRQSLFAELIINYGKELGEEEYVQRGLSALRASFVMMYCPENPETMEQWKKVYPYFNEKDYGFMMENYGHGGETNAEGLGIGEFTIYDWGNGAAAEAYNRIVDHFGEEFVNTKRN